MQTSLVWSLDRYENSRKRRGKTKGAVLVVEGVRVEGVEVVLQGGKKRKENERIDAG